MINLKKDFIFGDTVLVNFLRLSDKEKEIVRRWRNNKNIRKWMYSEHIISLEEHKRFIEKLKDSEKDFYWLVKTKDEEHIGVIYLNRVDFTNKNAYLGIYSNPNLKGVGSILMSCLKKIAFDILKLHSLKLEVIETNKKAVEFYKKQGFSEEGRLKEFVYKDKKWLDVIVMGWIKDKAF